MTSLWNDLLVLWEEWDTMECGSNPGSLGQFSTWHVCEYEYQQWMCRLGVGCWGRSVGRDYGFIGFPNTNASLYLYLWHCAEDFAYVCVIARVVCWRCEWVDESMWIYRAPAYLPKEYIWGLGSWSHLNPKSLPFFFSSFFKAWDDYFSPTTWWHIYLRR